MQRQSEALEEIRTRTRGFLARTEAAGGMDTGEAVELLATIARLADVEASVPEYETWCPDCGKGLEATGDLSPSELRSQHFYACPFNNPEGV